MRRKRLTKKSNIRNFKRTASRVHKKNLRRRKTRGGYRL